MQSPLLNEQLLKLLEDSRCRQQLSYALKKRSNSEMCSYRDFLLAAKECQYTVGTEANLMQIRQCFENSGGRIQIVKLIEMLSLEKLSVGRGGMPRSRSRSVRMRLREKIEICPSIMEHTEEDDQKNDIRPVEALKATVFKGIPSIPSISYPMTEGQSQQNHSRTCSRFSEPCLLQPPNVPSSCRSRLLSCIDTQQIFSLLTFLHRQCKTILKLFESFHVLYSIALEGEVIVKSVRTSHNQSQVDAIFALLSSGQDRITKGDLTKLENYDNLAKEIEKNREYFKSDPEENISVRHRPFRNAEIVLMKSKKPSVNQDLFQMLFLQGQDSIQAKEFFRPGTSLNKSVIPPKTARTSKRKRSPVPITHHCEDIQQTLKEMMFRKPLQIRKSLPQKLRRIDPQSPRQTLTTQLRRLFNNKIRKMNEETKEVNSIPSLRLESSRMAQRKNKFDFSVQL